jgi:hypothetical protein
VFIISFVTVSNGILVNQNANLMFESKNTSRNQEIYQDIRKSALAESASFKDRISFLQNRLTDFSNLTNTHRRKRMEAVAIKLF